MWTLVGLAAIAAAFIVIEHIFPDQELPNVKGWWARVILLNILQLGIVMLGMLTFERWLQGYSLFALAGIFSPFAGGILAYFALTFVFYWWHRLRHDSNFFWLLCHQVHHSPKRIETVTSFFKHPIEIFINSLIISSVVYAIFGFSLESGAWATFFSGIAEFIYHVNIKTPYWLGFFIQRPESHRIHHERGKHYKNFADLPIWDILFGTFENPKPGTRRVLCGFEGEREHKLADMLLLRNVNNPYKGQ